MKKLDAVILDSDGVVLDSVASKVRAFRRWVREYDAEREEVFMSYHLGAYGTPRHAQSVQPWTRRSCHRALIGYQEKRP